VITNHLFRSSEYKFSLFASFCTENHYGHVAPYSAVSNTKVAHGCNAEDARIALPRRVLGQGVSVAASGQFVWFLGLRSQGLGVGLEFTVPWVATYVVDMRHAVSLLGRLNVKNPLAQQLRLLRLIILVIMIVVHVCSGCRLMHI